MGLRRLVLLETYPRSDVAEGGRAFGRWELSAEVSGSKKCEMPEMLALVSEDCSR